MRHDLIFILSLSSVLFASCGNDNDSSSDDTNELVYQGTIDTSKFSNSATSTELPKAFEKVDQIISGFNSEFVKFDENTLAEATSYDWGSVEAELWKNKKLTSCEQGYTLVAATYKRINLKQYRYKDRLTNENQKIVENKNTALSLVEKKENKNKTEFYQSHIDYSFDSNLLVVREKSNNVDSFGNANITASYTSDLANNKLEYNFYSVGKFSGGDSNVIFSELAELDARKKSVSVQDANKFFDSTFKSTTFFQMINSNKIIIKYDSKKLHDNLSINVSMEKDQDGNCQILEIP